MSLIVLNYKVYQFFNLLSKWYNSFYIVFGYSLKIYTFDITDFKFLRTLH